MNRPFFPTGLNRSGLDSNASAQPGLFIIVIVSNLLTHRIGFSNVDFISMSHFNKAVTSLLQEKIQMLLEQIKDVSDDLHKTIGKIDRQIRQANVSQIL